MSRVEMYNGKVYAGGKFEDFLNTEFSLANIQKTADLFKANFPNQGTYQFGAFAKMVNPHEQNWENAEGKTDGFGKWGASVLGIPQGKRDELTKAIADNLMSKTPLPMIFKVGENVDDTHEVRIFNFNVKAQDYIGIHMLCPNPIFEKK